MRLSVELIPRDRATLLAETAEIVSHFPLADTINIPDLTRFDLRSWEAVSLIRAQIAHSVPHIRAIDIDPNGALPGLDQEDLREILVVRGDPSPDLRRRSWPNLTDRIIRRYRREAPHLKIYAAFDPYRRAPWEELDEVSRKIDAGADGFFTQPIFDRRMLDLCQDWLHGKHVFWGISPVIGPKSRSYWETTNRVVFPSDFQPTLEANIAFAIESIRDIRAQGGSVYLMPLRVKLLSYLAPILSAL